MAHPQDRKYTKEHEWVRLDGERAVVGITDHAQDELGDVVYVELPEVGRKVQQGEAFAVVESVKAVSEVYAPLSGEVLEVNEALNEAPELINRSPHDEGWIAVLKPADPAELEGLLDAAAYEAHIGAEG